MDIRRISGVVVVLGFLAAAGGGVRCANALSTAFTYQGQLRQSGSPTTGTCDLQFGLFDAASGGTQIGAPQAKGGVSVSNGVFTVQLDFGAGAFTGEDRWLEIGVRCPSGTGNLATLTPRQPLTAAPNALFAPVAAFDAGGNQRATMKVLQTGEGFISTQGPNGHANVLITSLATDSNNGFLGVYQDGNQRVGIGALDTGDGFLQTQGPNGNTNVIISSLANNPNNGFIAVYDSSGMSKAGMYVDADGKGVVFGDTKNFAVDHPNRADAKIMYVSLEGPEVAIYHRGVVKLINGRATIELPEHFVALANPDTITVQLTPGSFASEGLAFGAIHDGRIEVGELHDGKGSYDVHFVVHALRRGYEHNEPVISAEEFRKRFRSVSMGARSDAQAPLRARDVTTQAAAAGVVE